ncbi:MAG: hypothetical protein NT141_02070 [candidate division WWE3 bacterium]|nr:hypothetical protein [candidate division WWE3 bacterium]
MPKRVSIILEFSLLLIAIIILKPTPAFAAAPDPVACFTNEDPTFGGVTRGNSTSFNVLLNMKITDFYCAAPNWPVASVLEGNDATHMDVGTNCPAANDPAVLAKIVAQLKSQIENVSLIPGAMTNPSVLSQANFQGDTTWTLLRPPSDITPNKVNNITGQTALNTVGTSKIYYAACTNVPEVGPVWFSMAKDVPAPQGKVLPSYRKEAAASFYLQNYLTQVPGDDPIIKELKKETPVFNDNTTSDLLPFPKLSFQLASRKIAESDYLIYWKLCAKKGPVDTVKKNISCQLSNFITDIEHTDVSGAKSLVAEIPNDAWGKNTGDDFTCFTTGDFDTHPLKVTATPGSSYPLSVKLIGTPIDENVCQNNAQLDSAVYLDPNNQLAYSGYSTTPHVAFCNGVNSTVVNNTSQSVCIGGDCHVTAIAKFFNDASAKISAVFDNWIHQLTPTTTWGDVNPDSAASCQKTAEDICNGPKGQGASDNLIITQSTDFNWIQVDPAAKPVDKIIKVFVTNNSKRDATLNVYSQVLVTSERSLPVTITTSNAAGSQNSPQIAVYGNTIYWNGLIVPANGVTTELDYHVSVTAINSGTISATSGVSGDIYKTVTFYSDTNFACQKVAGVGTNSCDPKNNDADCSAKHLACNNGTGICELVNGAGTNTCLTNSQCKDDKRHLDCVGNACVAVQGTGVDNCNRLASCNTTTHTGCSLDSANPTCASFTYVGPNKPTNNCSISGNSGCDGANSSSFHMECSSVGKPEPRDVSQPESTSTQSGLITVSSTNASDDENLCVKIAKIVCYITTMPSLMSGYSYTQPLEVKVYPYPEASYTQGIDTQAASPKDGLFNLFYAPGQDNKIAALSEKDVDAKAGLNTNINGNSPATDASIKGSQQTLSPLKYLQKNALCPPGQEATCPDMPQTVNEAMPTDGSIPPPDTPPLPGPVVPGANVGFSVPACTGGNDVAISQRSTYTQNILAQAAAAEGVPVSLLTAILTVESGNDALISANGTAPVCVTSVCSARGWFQITSGYQNVDCSECSAWCCDYNNDSIKEAVCLESRSAFDPPGNFDLCNPAQSAIAAAKVLKAKMGVDGTHVWTIDDACVAAARYFGADSSACETSGGYYPRLANCTYGGFVKKFVNITGL